MLLSEQKLPVEVREINGIKVNNVDFAEASEDEVLQQFTSYASSAHHKRFGILDLVRQPVAEALGDVGVSMGHGDQVIEVRVVRIWWRSEELEVEVLSRIALVRFLDLRPVPR